MALRTILEFPDPRLRTRAEPVTRFDAALGALIDDMLETMYAAPGIGLAATQVDVHKRLIVIDISEEHNEPLVLINPEILAREGEAQTEEGCLSVPGIFDEVKRAARVRVRAQDRNGDTFERDYEDVLAVCIQHDPTSEQVPPAEPDPRPLETGIKAQSTDIWAGRSGIREGER